MDTIIPTIRLNQNGLDGVDRLATAFATLGGVVEQVCWQGGGRELALVRTKLQEAGFFAYLALANNPVNLVEES